jgi:tripartite-type tricarboxylate transporter receptor subunit TctC
MHAAGASALPLSPCGRGKARAMLALLFFIGCTAYASAQDNYPSHPITLIAPYAAGGSMDLVSRIVAEGLTARLGQSVLVDVKPGGNGVIGIREALKAPPDGYTLLLGSVGANVTPSLMQPNYPFDPLRDYVPVAMVAEWSAILVVKKELPVNTLAEFIAYAKARPGKINFGATGYGGLAHLVGEVFMQKTGIAMQHVQYKGGSQSTTDLLSGAIDATFMSSAVAAGQVDSPRLKMLAVASKHRLGFAPNLPTMAEAGAPGVDQTSWQAVFSAPGVPQAIRERLAREVFAVVNDPVFQDKFRATGFEPLPLDGPATQAMYRDEIVRWTAFIKERGLAEKGR